MAAYLFITDTDYNSGKITGAHRRFLELVKGVAEHNKVVLIASNIPQLRDDERIRMISTTSCKFNLPAHIRGMIELIGGLKNAKGKVTYDYAVSFHATNTICYKLCGYKKVTSIFREDLVGYQKSIGASALKIGYYRLIEYLAVKASDKVIVQCNSDKTALLDRHQRFVHGLNDKVYVQINNANASWMNTNCVERRRVETEKINILFIGDFSDDRKGHKQLLEAVSTLIDENYNINLYIAGDGSQLKFYRKKYEGYRGINFLGRVAVKDYFEICDFEMVPSLMDSCPNTVLEGINAGIAVYGSNRGGIPDLLEKAEYLFEPDYNSICSFLRRIIDGKRYIVDSIRQKEIKSRLSFNWAGKIEEIIEE